MPYIKKIYNAGGIIEVKKTYSARFGLKGIARSENCNPTPLDVEKVNDANAEQKLRLLLFTNFKANDWHLVFTYRPLRRPSPDQAKAVFKKQVQQMRKHFKKELGIELKYIYVTEYESTAIHHHMIIPDADIRPLQKMWREYGTLRGTPIRDTQHLANLAYYFIKETKHRKDGAGRHQRRWIASTNLKKPTVKIIKVSASEWAKEPKAKKGYYIDKTVGDGSGVKNYENPLNGLPCQFYRLIPWERAAEEKFEDFPTV